MGVINSIKRRQSQVEFGGCGCGVEISGATSVVCAEWLV